jgi:DNA-binding NtrC family response regulator
MSDKPVILVVDDDKNTRDGLQRALQRHYAVRTAESAEAALAALAEAPAVDVMLSDLRMPGTDGLGLLRRVNAQYPQTICILLTAYGSVETAVEAMKQGAYDFLTKPINLDHLDMLVARAIRSRDLEKKVETLETQLNEKFGMENITGESPAMREVFEIVRQTAPTQASVLIQGPSGTGKELVAQAIHRLSTRAKGPFVAVHCAALSPTLLESELFGHEKGAFTGATVQRKGRFEMADGGTLFLDEISEIDPSTQVKLLRVLEERTFERVGGEETIEVDIRVIAATNRNLRKMVDEGKFREDLWYRLDVVRIGVPPLRERHGDVPLLAGAFLRRYNGRYNLEARLTESGMKALSDYTWPGNVRQLQHMLERLVILAPGGRITEDAVEDSIRASAPKETSSETLADTEADQIRRVLAATGGNKSRAARILGIERKTLYRKLERMGEVAGAN